MEKINYFDIGTHKGDEINMFLNVLSPIECNVYGFEAFPLLYNTVLNRYSDNPKVNIYNKIISNRDGIQKLYLAKSNDYEGNSIFATKSNVNKDSYVEIQSIKLSNWILKNVLDFKTSINVIRFNIEGAELYMIEDLINSGLIKYFKVFLGAESGIDILKCSEIANQYDYYMNLLLEYKIIVYQYCSVTKKGNISSHELKKIIFK